MKCGKRSFFEKHAQHWDNHPEPRNLKRVVEEVEIKKGSMICDVGTGTGVLVPYLLEKTGKKGKVIAIDYAPAMIEQAIRKLRHLPVEFIIADIHHTCFPDNYFDYVICNACYPHFDRKKTAIKEIYRILKKDGSIVISHPTGKDFVNNLHKSTGGCIEKDRVPEAKILAKTLASHGFSVLKIIDEPDFYFVSGKKI
ncbi:MAG TPA: class I SAM-dependent methyltransferase [bacterium]|nr:class I SAM-dependent methyltransferase [bacterium]